MTRWRWPQPQRGDGARLAAARARADAEARLQAAKELTPVVEHIASTLEQLPADELVDRMRRALAGRWS
ncbi:MAG TPA: hypothetical protein VF163_11270 [Micromonosporaceae bacterium]